MSGEQPIYLDNAATTQPCHEVVRAMLTVLQADYGNPSSLHAKGFSVRHKVEEARNNVAKFIGARSAEQVIFTSGATESIALAFASIPQEVQQIILSGVEHAAVIGAARRWSAGRNTITIPVDAEGLLNLCELEMALKQAPSFVSVMHANNETGVLFDVQHIARLCREHGAILHVDAVQAVGKVAVDVSDWNCDYLSLSAHKFHGPKGIGILYARQPTLVQALLSGHQEGNRRGGTENVPGIVGMAAALNELTHWQNQIPKLTTLRDHFERGVLSAIPGAVVNGHLKNRIASISNISLPHTSAADFVMQLSRRGVYVSAGAACSSGREPSHVILAMHGDPTRAESSLRFSLSRFTTKAEISDVVQIVTKCHNQSLRRFDIPA